MNERHTSNDFERCILCGGLKTLETTARTTIPIDSFALISVTQQQANERSVRETRNCAGLAARSARIVFLMPVSAQMIEGEKINSTCYACIGLVVKQMNIQTRMKPMVTAECGYLHNVIVIHLRFHKRPIAGMWANKREKRKASVCACELDRCEQTNK